MHFPSIQPAIRALWLTVLFSGSAVRAETSALWGTNGEAWNARSRLPDFSYAGYHCGEAPLPEVPLVASVKTFGAKGDGISDDSDAFLAALAGIKRGAIEIPAGRYRLTKILEINRPGVVLRGAGPDKTILFFPKPLNDIKPDWGATTGGQRTSNYSWSGGFVWFQGNLQMKALTDITAPALRGDCRLTVASTDRLRSGQRVVIEQTDTPDNSLATELYSGDPGNTRNLHGKTRAILIGKILRMEGANVFFDRPLRFNLQLKWKPTLKTFDPTVTESGIENLAFEFPNTPYRGHFTEVGYNAVTFSGVSDCWARNLRILNADSGIFACGCFCTVQGLVIQSLRQPNQTHSTGHHGFSFYGQDNLLIDFDFRSQFIHDLSVDGGASGNVSAQGKGVDLCFDHHKRTSYENLFTDIDVGAGTHLWRHGGGDALGKPCGARETFWNIRSRQPQPDPPADFGPPSINLVALQGDLNTGTNQSARWHEAIPPAKILPQDIHAAQLDRRLNPK